MNSTGTRTPLDYADFDVLSFDCYGTLIDWEAGIGAVLSGWAADVGLVMSTEELLLAYAGHEAAVEVETPTALYPSVLAEAFARTGADLGRPTPGHWLERLATSVPDWPAFPDSAAALATLAERFQLVIVSNVDRESFAGSNARLGVTFDRIITAEDVGSYKPAEGHFRALDTALEEMGVDRSRLLHVAQSLFHDHVPARREGLHSAWINRRHDVPGWGATPEPSHEWSYDVELTSMAELADAVVASTARRITT